MEGEIITMQEIFTFKQTGMAADGKVSGHVQATGIRPKFADKLRNHGVEPPGRDVRPGHALRMRVPA